MTLKLCGKWALLLLACCILPLGWTLNYGPKMCLADQMTHLRSLHASTKGHNWVIPWNISRASDPCTEEWYGIQCDKHGNVIHIELSNNNLVGNLPKNIGRFPKLRTLDVSENQLAGELPEGITQLTNLRKWCANLALHLLMRTAALGAAHSNALAFALQQFGDQPFGRADEGGAVVEKAYQPVSAHA